MGKTSFTPYPLADAFAQAESYLSKGRAKTSRPITSTSYLARVDDDTIALVLHHTAVVTYHRSGVFTIYGGGWNTVTTKARIREFSPANPYSDGSGGWIVGATGEVTAPRVQKCRTCKGRGKWQELGRCYGPSWNYSAGPAKRDESCRHGETAQHSTELEDRSCYRCSGEGRLDYGSKSIPVTVTASDAYQVDASGVFLGEVSRPYAPSKAYTPSPVKAPAYASVSTPAHSVGSELVGELAAVLPNLTAEVKHPVSGTPYALRNVIVDLNDSQHWSREQIADWLDTLDLDLRFPSSTAV